MARRVIALVADVIFLAKIRETARNVDTDVVSVKTRDALVEAARAGADLIVVDLGDARLAALEAIAALEAEPELGGVPVMGFYPHVMTELRERALAAGCDAVLPRSKFSRDLARILAGDRT